MTEVLEVLADALERNAADFRRRGLDCCAQQAEQILTRLREAMALAT